MREKYGVCLVQRQKVIRVKSDSSYNEKEVIPMPDLRQQVNTLISEINGDIQHGECFYEKNMLDSLIEKLDKIKYLATKHYVKNQEAD